MSEKNIMEIRVKVYLTDRGNWNTIFHRVEKLLQRLWKSRRIEVEYEIHAKEDRPS